ncbi:serine/threonine protein kinase [Pseudomonas sp. W3I7]|uniref:serine/threonine-protein kinase n=1 Tax=Pseudomonas sp. W3I7 TaxID=3042292 RepID=UPI00278DAAEE|nr:serine/threonine-protein kinase [Pseudomonas sp. W3I7]MDQ0707176.1 serine/threonine protein kinase [Pseudomonas sp. W3I7]
MNYVFIKEKGRGGFARVDIIANQTGQQFAQKVYDPQPHLIHAVGDEHLKQRFIREVRYQSQISHPNVVVILEQYLESNPPFFIMPLADCTLREELDYDPTLGENLHTALFDILAGLEHIHSLGITHRDLKPANILRFTSSEGKFFYAISDFGLMSASNSQSSTLTGTNANGGTENYAAPELIGNFRQATPSADIYAFGAILHDVFGNSAQRIPYTELTLPGHIGKIIEKCTKRLPIRRYANVSILRDELYQVLNTQPVTFNSSGEESVVELLRNGKQLNDDEWDLVFIQIERNISKNQDTKNILEALSIDHIQFLNSQAPNLFVAMGSFFSEHINGNSFNFDYCDVLASKAECFYNGSGLDLKANIALALLYLGTSHNRWYVERKAAGMLGADIPDAQAERIRIEIEVQRIDFARQVAHMTRSIGFHKANLHPILLPLA